MPFNVIIFPKWTIKYLNFRSKISPLFFTYFHRRHLSSRELEFHYWYVLDKCTEVSHLSQVHSQLYAQGLHENGFVITKFINKSADLKEIDHARKLFDEIPHKHVFLWNAIIRGYSLHNEFERAIEMYLNMRHDFATPDSYTFPHVLRACGGLPAEKIGRAVHAHIFRLGFAKDVFLQNGLVTFYVRCNRITSAHIVFVGLANRDVVSWTAMISGYTQTGQPMKGSSFFSEMTKFGLKPDWMSLVSVLKALSDLNEFELGRCIHSLVVKIGFEFELDLQVALMAFYAKCGEVTSAKSLFDQSKLQNVILWSVMISGFAKNGYANEALELFQEMISKNILPNAVTLQSAAAATAQLGSLEQAKSMDSLIKISEFRDDVFVRTAMIDMYAKCGSLELACQVFNQIPNKDVVVWSAMIMSYALHGFGEEAADLFTEMQHAKVSPNDVTFLGLITACSHSGLVDTGLEFFRSMKDYDVQPHQQHYAGVVDLLGRAGYIEKAYNFISTMPVEPGVSVWGALLSACKVHRFVRLGEYAAERLFELDPLNKGHYVQLSNLYATARKWNGVAKVRVLMKAKGVSKDLGYSTIEINGKLETFRMGDKLHSRSEEIYKKLEWLEMRLLESGFSHDVDSSLHDLDEEEKENTLCDHSERLAIAYGLISTDCGMPLRITKNLRACVNCHLATKLISKLVSREIIVRDVQRFHHFKDGNCSCGDYW